MLTVEGSAGANPANPERLRERLTDLLGIDRWVDAAYPVVAPTSGNEVEKLLTDYPGELMVIGHGSSFPEDFVPAQDVLFLLTTRLVEKFDYSPEDQVVEISAGWSIAEARTKLLSAGVVVPAWEKFQSGTIGGRIAGTSSRYEGGRDNWRQSILGITVALPDGEQLDFGGRCIKDVAGYDLRHIFTGSRGNLGVILKAIFRCRPQSEWASYDYSSSVSSPAGRISPVIRKLFDPKGRMRPGI